MDEDARDPSHGAAPGAATLADGPGAPGSRGDGRFWAGVRVLGIAAVQLALAAGVQLLCVTALKSLEEGGASLQAAITIPVAFTLAAFLVAASFGPGSDRRWLKLGAPEPGSWKDLVLILTGGFAVMALLGILATRLPGFEEAMHRQKGIAHWHTPGGLIAVVVLLAVLPALTEELYFRGLLLHRLVLAWGPLAAALAQAALFASLHGPAWPIALGIGGMSAALVLRSGSLWPGIVLHLLNNLGAVFASN